MKPFVNGIWLLIASSFFMPCSFGIKVKGHNVPDLKFEFSEMPFDAEIKDHLLGVIESSTWKEPTPIQMQAIPCLLQKRNVIAIAPTGSGKTASYLLPLFHHIVQYKRHGNEEYGGSTQRSMAPPCAKRPKLSIAPIKSLILVPTKELAIQVYKESVRWCPAPGRREEGGLCHVPAWNLRLACLSMDTKEHPLLWWNCDTVITTPLKLLQSLEALETSSESRVSAVDRSGGSAGGGVASPLFRDLRYLVIDEMDLLLEMNSKIHREHSGSGDGREAAGLSHAQYIAQMDEIFHRIALTNNHSCLTCVTSATVTNPVIGIIEQVFPSPSTGGNSGRRNMLVDIRVGGMNVASQSIAQHLLFVGTEQGKTLALRQLITEGKCVPPVLIFVQSIDRAQQLHKELQFSGYRVQSIHSNKSPALRAQIMEQWEQGKIWFLICTDVMARGMDFKDVQAVVNYDFPPSVVAYIHRIGRTGRGGREGVAYTLYTESDLSRVRPIANVIHCAKGQKPIDSEERCMAAEKSMEVPEWMLTMKKVRYLALISFF